MDGRDNGVTGYAGGEVCRLLIGHPHLRLAGVHANSSAGRRLGELQPHLLPYAGLEVRPSAAADLAGYDVVVPALPHGESAAIPVKRNQPTLYAALAALPWSRSIGSCADGWARPSREPLDRGAGRDGAPAIDTLFPRAAQVMRVIRSRTDRKTGTRFREVVYAITCLDHRQADLGLLAGWLQNQRGIENRVDHERDVTHGEDAIRIRTGTGPQLITAVYTGIRPSSVSRSDLRGAGAPVSPRRREPLRGARRRILSLFPGCVPGAKL